MRVLYHAERQAFPGHRDGIHERGQPPPPGIRIDLGQLHIGIGDAHQVIEERQVLRVCIANLGIDLHSGGMRVKTLDAGGRARQPRHDVEGIWLVCDSQKAVNTRAERSALRRDTAVTQAQAVVDLIHAASAGVAAVPLSAEPWRHQLTCWPVGRIEALVICIHGGCLQSGGGATDRLETSLEQTSNARPYPNRYPNQARFRRVPAKFAEGTKRRFTCADVPSAEPSDPSRYLGVKWSQVQILSAQPRKMRSDLLRCDGCQH